MSSSSERRADAGLSVAVWIVASVSLVFFLRTASQLLIPIVIAVLLGYALEPAVSWLARHHVPRLAGAGLVIALILALCGWGAYSLRDDAARAFEALPEAIQRARTLVLSDSVSTPVHHVKRAAEALQGSERASQEQPDATNKDRRDQAVGGAMDTWVQRGASSVLALAGHLTVIMFLVFFLLMSGGHFKKRLVELAGARLEQRRITATIINDINVQIQRFLLVRLFTSVVVALATWGSLAWMGVGQAGVWGVLAGVFNSIPYFGPIIVSGGLLCVGLAQSGDLTHAVKMSGVALAITSLEGWLLTPPLLGKAEHMHVVVVFLGVLFWTWMWGAWGTILAVPMLVFVKSIADHVESLKPLGRLMAP